MQIREMLHKLQQMFYLQKDCPAATSLDAVGRQFLSRVIALSGGSPQQFGLNQPSFAIICSGRRYSISL